MTRDDLIPLEVVVDLWTERDQRYRSRRTGLSPEEESAVVMWRRREAEKVPGHARYRAEAILARWAPPVVRRIA